MVSLFFSPIGSGSTQVILGAHFLTAAEPNQQRRTVASAQYRLHAAYNPSNLNNDIAVLIILTPFTLNQFVGTIPLAPAGAPAFVGATTVVSGWGRIGDGAGGGTSANLRSVTNTVISNAVCSQTYGGIIIASTICISTTGGRGTCSGTSKDCDMLNNKLKILIFLNFQVTRAVH